MAAARTAILAQAARATLNNSACVNFAAHAGYAASFRGAGVWNGAHQSFDACLDAVAASFGAGGTGRGGAAPDGAVPLVHGFQRQGAVCNGAPTSRQGCHCGVLGHRRAVGERDGARACVEPGTGAVATSLDDRGTKWRGTALTRAEARADAVWAERRWVSKTAPRELRCSSRRCCGGRGFRMGTQAS